MIRLRGVPPGRVGLFWLEDRLAVVRRGGQLLDVKLRLLDAEVARRTEEVTRTAQTWEKAHAQARTWLLRAGLLTGERGLRLAAVPADAEVVLTWSRTMGVRYPDSGTMRFPARGEGAPPLVNAALPLAREAHQAALVAAVHHAVAVAALGALRTEARVTRQRLRALTTHWAPLLTAALAERRLSLDEQEREDNGRLRWARPTGPSPSRPHGLRRDVISEPAPDRQEPGPASRTGWRAG